MFKSAIFDAVLKLFLGSGIKRLSFQIEKAPNDPDPDAYLIHIFSADKEKITAGVKIGCAGSHDVFGITNLWWRKYEKYREGISRREQER